MKSHFVLMFPIRFQRSQQGECTPTRSFLQLLCPDGLFFRSLLLTPQLEHRDKICLCSPPRIIRDPRRCSCCGALATPREREGSAGEEGHTRMRCDSPKGDRPAMAKPARSGRDDCVKCCVSYSRAFGPRGDHSQLSRI